MSKKTITIELDADLIEQLKSRVKTVMISLRGDTIKQIRGCTIFKEENKSFEQCLVETALRRIIYWR